MSPLEESWLRRRDVSDLRKELERAFEAIVSLTMQVHDLTRRVRELESK